MEKESINELKEDTKRIAIKAIRNSDYNIKFALEDIYNAEEKRNILEAARIAHKNFQTKRALSLYDKLENNKIGKRLIYKKLNKFDNQKSLIDYQISQKGEINQMSYLNN